MKTHEGSATLSILVIDDNRDNADTLATVLAAGGHEVSVAYDGNEAVRLIDSAPFDVAFCDIGLPGKSGYEIATHVRDAAAHKPLLVAVSGFPTKDVVAAARASGFDYFFGKPADPVAIEGLLRDWMTRHDDSRKTDEVPVKPAKSADESL